MGQYGTSGRTLVGVWRKDCDRASHNRLSGHSKGFWDEGETERDRDVTN